MAGASTVAGVRLELKGVKPEVRLGDTVEAVVDLEVLDPWFEVPELGRRISSVDGRTVSSVLAFEADAGREVPALISGSATVRDSRIDVHTPSGFPDVGAGRGVEVLVRAGALEVRYGHLERGSTRAGAVKAGDAVGRMGNTGRCVDGCGRRFVVVEVTGGRLARTLDELAAPIDVEAFFAGKSIGRTRFPAGELKVKGLRVARGHAPRERGSAKVWKLEVKVTRGGKPLASESHEMAIRL